jgi:hypothetical protein
MELPEYLALEIYRPEILVLLHLMIAALIQDIFVATISYV